MYPVILKGRGAVSAPIHRFAKLQRSQDGDWLEQRRELDDVAPAPDTSVQHEQARSLIQRNRSPDIFFDLSINPYRGCEHGCVYCYARPNHAYLELSPGLDFERKLFAKTNAPELLRAELQAPGYRCSPINIGSVTDAYQPIEREYQLTRRCIEVMRELGQPLTIITKSALIERDIDLLAEMAKRSQAAVFVTITTLDPELARIWEPRAAAPWRRLHTIRKLAQAGVPVGVMVAPITPFINDHEIEAIMEQAAQAGARSAHYTVLRLPFELKEVFQDWLQEHRPLAAQRVLARLRDLRAPVDGAKRKDGSPGRLNDPRFITRMKGEGHWADLIAMRFGLAAKRFGLRRDRPDLDCSGFFAPVLARGPALGNAAQGVLFD